jgi:hypothetical protein
LKLASSSLAFSNVEASCSSAITKAKQELPTSQGNAQQLSSTRKFYIYVLVVLVNQSIRRLPELLICNQFKYRLQQLIEISENYLNSLPAQ